MIVNSCIMNWSDLNFEATGFPHWAWTRVTLGTIPLFNPTQAMDYTLEANISFSNLALRVSWKLVAVLVGLHVGLLLSIPNDHFVKCNSLVVIPKVRRV